MAGYSGTPLPQKLGIKPATVLTLVNAPVGIAAELRAAASSQKGRADVVVIFATEAIELEQAFLGKMKTLPPEGAIWCAWPKRASRVPTDITENLLRDLFLRTGMVDNKVAAIDEVWSGLRFVVRKELRAAWNKSA